MIQILPHIPGFGERLADSLTGAAGNVGLGFVKQMQNERSDRALQDVANPNLSPFDRFRAYGKLSPELQKNLAQPFSALIGPESQAAADIKGYQNYNAMNGQPPQQPSSVNNPQQPPSGGLAPQNIPQGVAPPIGQQQPAQEDLNPQSPTEQLQNERNQLINETKKAGSKNPYLAGEGKAAEYKLKYLDKIEDEWVQENKKFGEPYSDLGSLRRNKQKLESVKELLKNENFSLDKNIFRNGITAILSDEFDTFAELLKTPGEKKAWSLLRDALRPKELGGSNPSTKEVLLAKSTLPSGLNDTETNEYILDNLILDADKNIKTAEAINKANASRKTIAINPGEFRTGIDNAVSPYLEEQQKKINDKFYGPKIKAANQRIKSENIQVEPNEILMITPDGKPVAVLKDRIDEALENKFTLPER
jgi:hypothetical protein